MSARGDCIAAKKEFDVCVGVRMIANDESVTFMLT
jgi:hypothetical protein